MKKGVRPDFAGKGKRISVEGMSGVSHEEERGSWIGEYDFLLSTINYAVGVGNIWRFPFYTYRNGGGAFLIPYMVAVILCAIPIFLLECSMGQYFGLGNMQIVEKVAPMLKGAAYSTQFMTFWINIYFCVISAWGVAYLVQSLVDIPNLPWKTCPENSTWATEKCSDNTTHLGNDTIPVVEEFWENKILNLSSGLGDIGGMQWDLFLYLFFGWVLSYVVIWNGLHQSGKIMWFTALFPYIVLTILLIRAVTLTGAGEGLKFYVTPDFSKLKSATPWMEAGSQVFYSYGLGFGTLVALGSFNHFNYHTTTDAFLVAFVNSGTSIYGGIVTFSVLGNMAYLRNTTVSEVVAHGPGLIYLTYPEVVSKLPGGVFWSVLFFAMFINMGVNSNFCMVEGMVTSFVDEWPSVLIPYRRCFTFGICVFFWLTGVTMVTQNGMYLFRLIDNYGSSGVALMSAALFQNIIFAWILGLDRAYDIIEEMTGNRPSMYWGICWKYLGPAFMIFMMIFFCMQYEPLTFDSRRYGLYTYPLWAQILCWVITGTSIICIPLYAIYYIFWKSPLPFLQAVKAGLTPIPEVMTPLMLQQPSRLTDREILPKEEYARRMTRLEHLGRVVSTPGSNKSRRSSKTRSSDTPTRSVSMERSVRS